MPGVRVNRKVKAGKHGILEVFPGLDRSAAFRAIFPDGLRQEVLRDCRIDVVPEDMYMHFLGGYKQIDSGKSLTASR